jgi:hypothetical protein
MELPRWPTGDVDGGSGGAGAAPRAPPAAAPDGSVKAPPAAELAKSAAEHRYNREHATPALWVVVWIGAAIGFLIGFTDGPGGAFL